ncbi:hypothetical protein [Bordetella bronchialis]|uniref:hypothetical protein n=1 Tax=Bordetella bronchialis TaxID=463025 RepID=UPI0012EAB408|nr:hypothetical protein [Bordetella bronchialis]
MKTNTNSSTGQPALGESPEFTTLRTKHTADMALAGSAVVTIAALLHDEATATRAGLPGRLPADADIGLLAALRLIGSRMEISVTDMEAEAQAFQTLRTELH